MGINKKGKRKIVVDAKTYIWWAYNEYDQTTFDGNQVMIVTNNQVVCLKYGLEQDDYKRIMSLSFRNGGGVNIKCPKFENDSGIITPSGISELIKWAILKPDDNITRKITYGHHNVILNELEANLLYLKILDAINEV